MEIPWETKRRPPEMRRLLLSRSPHRHQPLRMQLDCVFAKGIAKKI